MKKALFWSLVLLMSASCVSTKKFDALASEKRQVLQEKEMLNQQMATLKTQLEGQIKAKDNELANRQTALERTQDEVGALQKANQDLMKQYDALLAQNQAALDNASEEKVALSGELATQQKELDEKERELQFLAMKLKSQEENLHSLQEDVRIRERKLAELTEELNTKDSIMQSLLGSVHEALRGFDASDLTVTEYNGKVYVSLSQKLLFAKGSNALDPAGREAIRKLTQVLKEHPDIQINVEGHTDSDGTSEKNWDLSVTRATSVVKALQAYGLNPSQVTASGRAFYYPKAPNDTEDNKSINRRTEIILSPNLDALYELIGS